MQIMVPVTLSVLRLPVWCEEWLQVFYQRPSHDLPVHCLHTSHANRFLLLKSSGQLIRTHIHPFLNNPGGKPLLLDMPDHSPDPPEL